MCRFFFLDFQNNERSNKDSKILPICVVNDENSCIDDISNSNINQKTSDDNLKTMNYLIESIQTMACSIEIPSINDINKDDNSKNNKYSEIKSDQFFNFVLPENKLITGKNGLNDFNDLIKLPANTEINFNNNLHIKQESNKFFNQPLINTTTVDNHVKSNWLGSIRSTSLIRAANFICNKIVSADVPGQLAAKHSSISSFFVEGLTNNENNRKINNVMINENINFSRGRSTEKRSNTNSDSSLPPDDKQRDKLQPRFYHHEDDYTKKLRGASHQRREAAALAAKKKLRNAAIENNDTKMIVKNLPPPSPFTQHKILINKKTFPGVINSSTENVDNKYVKFLNNDNIEVNSDSLQKNRVAIGMRRTNSVTSKFNIIFFCQTFT